MHILFCVNNIKFGTKCFVKVEQFVLPFIKTIQNALSTTVHSFTKDRDYEVVISADFLTPNDNVLFVDDFLAYGNAALGILDLIEQSGAKLVGMGFIIEKAFQNGRKILEEKGVRVESLAIIEDLSNCCIKIKDQ